MSFRVTEDRPAFRAITPTGLARQAKLSGFKTSAPVGVLIGAKGDTGGLEDNLPDLVLLFEGALIS